MLRWRVNMKVEESKFRIGADVDASLAATICGISGGRRVSVCIERDLPIGSGPNLSLTFCRKVSAVLALTSSRYWREMTMSPFVFIRYSIDIIVAAGGAWGRALKGGDGDRGSSRGVGGFWC